MITGISFVHDNRFAGEACNLLFMTIEDSRSVDSIVMIEGKHCPCRGTGYLAGDGMLPGQEKAGEKTDGRNTVE
ncbi:MAG: hypothetical protein HFI91_04725 [Lachnospiraceae bacterium]|nr:hypothetical protein [Lachnospiraceae bacterium]